LQWASLLFMVEALDIPAGEVRRKLSVVNEFTGLIFTIGEGRDGGAGGPTNANGADISAGAVGF
jgi:hypothetical protein